MWCRSPADCAPYSSSTRSLARTRRATIRPNPIGIPVRSIPGAPSPSDTLPHSRTCPDLCSAVRCRNRTARPLPEGQRLRAYWISTDAWADSIRALSWHGTPFLFLHHHQLRQARRIVELLHSEHRIAQSLRPAPLERVGGQLFELGDDLLLAREIRLAAARRLHRAFQAAAVVENHLHPHAVAVFRALRADFGIGPDFDLFGEGHALRVGDDPLAELIDETIAFEQKRRRAESKVHLGRGEAFRAVFPAGVIDRHLRGVHQDFLHVLRAERPLRAHLAQRVERGVVAADAGIELQRDAQRLPGAAEARGQLGELEAIPRARKGGAEAAVLALEHVGDSGEAALSEQRAVEPALRGAARVHALQ